MIVNWDDVRASERRFGHLDASWRNLGRAIGSRSVGVRRVEIAPGRFSTPVHMHAAEEEIFFLLRGDGLLWQGGETFAVTAGDCILHAAGGAPHTLRGGAQGLDALAFGQRSAPALGHLPRTGTAWAIPGWIEIGAGSDPWEREAQAGPPECPPPTDPRAANIAALDEIERVFDGRARLIGRALGAQATALNEMTLAPGETAAPAHCHSLEEEIFVVLEGGGTLRLHAGDLDDPAEHPVRAGDAILRPAATGVAHELCPGPDGLRVLMYSAREANDICFYPQLGTVSLRGLGVSFKPEGLQWRPGRP